MIPKAPSPLQTVTLFGLPFDCVSLAQSLDLIRSAARARRRLFLSTVNVNWVAMAHADASFRQSILDSDLRVADGAPIVWIARLLKLPLPERVAGSDIVESLRRASGTPLKVYFFGGPAGVAEAACTLLNREAGGLHCVGFDSPGFGSIESMSTPEHIERINASGADFLVVSLGAKKGQAWIRHNLASIDVPVVSHLGAVVNFVAGSVERAPRWMQRGGLEWLWRIYQEPALAKRYFSDFLSVTPIMLKELTVHRKRSP